MEKNTKSFVHVVDVKNFMNYLLSVVPIKIWILFWWQRIENFYISAGYNDSKFLLSYGRFMNDSILCEDKWKQKYIVFQIQLIVIINYKIKYSDKKKQLLLKCCYVILYVCNMYVCNIMYLLVMHMYHSEINLQMLKELIITK